MKWTMMHYFHNLLKKEVLLLFLFIKQDTTKEYIVYEYHKVFLDIHLLSHIRLLDPYLFIRYSFEGRDGRTQNIETIETELCTYKMNYDALLS